MWDTRWIEVEPGVGSRVDVSLLKMVAFQRRGRLSNQLPNSDRVFRPPVNFARCFNGTENLFDASIVLDDGAEKIYPSLRRIVSRSEQLTKNDIFQPYLTQKNFITTNVRLVAPNIGHKKKVMDVIYDMRNRKMFLSAQIIRAYVSKFLNNILME